MEGNCPTLGDDEEAEVFSGVHPSCIVKIKSDSTGYVIVNDIWQGMTVEVEGEC